MDRINPEAFRLGCPLLANEFIWGQAFERLEPQAEVGRGRGAALWHKRWNPDGSPTRVPQRQRRRLHRTRDAHSCKITGSQAHQHARVQPTKQRHGREFREHLQA